MQLNDSTFLISGGGSGLGAATARLFSAPQYAYTRLLLSAVPSPDPDVRMNFNVGDELAKLDTAAT